MFVAVFLAAWFLLTVVYQFGWLTKPIRRYDYFRLIPRWSFFAPNPGHHDYHVVYRDRHGDDTLSAWQEVTALNCGHNVSCLWNPQRRVTKTVSDVIKNITIMRLNEQVPSEYIKFALVYLLLLQFVQAGGPLGTLRQFAIVRTHGFDDRRPANLHLVFLSDFHVITALDPTPGAR